MRHGLLTSRLAVALAASVAAGAAIGCGRAPGDASAGTHSTASTATASSEAPNQALDLASVQARAHYAFHRAGDGFDARGESYLAHVSDDGSVRVAAGHPNSPALRIATIDEARAASAPAMITAPARARDGSLHLHHDAYDERFENTAHGLEQSWTFASRPADLDVHLFISATGLPYIGKTSSGLLFGSGNARVHYSDATWIDASGKHSKIAVKWDGSQIALQVPRALLDSSTYPARLDPTIGPEVPVDPTPFYGAAIGIESQAAVGASSTYFYAVWEDQRRGLVDSNIATSDVYGGRIDPSTGLAVDADSAGVLLLPNVVLSEVSPGIIASAGGDFLVVVQTLDVYQAVRVDGTTGQPLASDVDGVTLAELPTAGVPSVGSLGDTYVVAWAAGSAIWAQRIGRSGPPIDAAPVRIATTTDATNQHMSCGGTVCLVTWNDSGASYFVRYDPTTGLAIASDRATPQTIPAIPSADVISSVTYGGGPFLVTWGSTTTGTGATSGARLDPATGTFVAGDGSGQTLIARNQSQIATTFDGTGYVAEFYQTPTEIDEASWSNGATVAEVGTKGVFYNLTPESNISVASVGTRSFSIGLAGAQVTGVPFDDLARVDTGASQNVANPANFQYQPEIASNGSGAYVAWLDGRTMDSGLIAIYGARLDTSGHVLPDDAAGVLLEESQTDEMLDPSVITDGTDYLVSWTSISLQSFATALNGARISAATGQPTATMSPVGGLGQNGGVAAYDGTSYTVGFVSGTSAGALFFDPKTLALTGYLPIPGVLGTGTEYTHPAMAYGGSSYLLTWSVFSLLGIDPPRLGGARFTAAGSVLDAPAILSVSAGSETQPALSAANGNYLLAWADGRDNPLKYSVYGRLIPVDGPLTAGSDFPVARSTDGLAVFTTDISPNVIDSRDGLNFQTVWADSQALYSALVSYDGTLRDTTSIPIGSGSFFEHPRLAAVSPGDMILTYGRYDATGPYGIYRIDTRTLSTGDKSGTCTSADDCASRNCRDGYCCDTPCDGACQTCAAMPGTCTSVHGGTDPDSCTGADVCTASGTCLSVQGSVCAKAADCASGNCVDGYCCESACDGGCDVCNAAGSVGKCTVIAAGSTGASPSCIPYICDGMSHICPSECASDTDCVRPYLCAEGGKCALQKTALCIDDETLKAPDGTTSSCVPYRCAGSACGAICKSIEDCVAGDVCDDQGACVAPEATSLAGGCALGSNGDGGGRSGRSGALWSMVVLAGAAFAARRNGKNVRRRVRRS